MLARGRGAIVNIASKSGSIVNRGLLQANYNTSKAGVVHLTKRLAMEWVSRNIRVNAISPGYTLTPMNIRPEVAEQRKIFEQETPIGRMATVDEMVGLPCSFLVLRPRSLQASTCSSPEDSGAGDRDTRRSFLAGSLVDENQRRRTRDHVSTGFGVRSSLPVLLYQFPNEREKRD